MQQRMIHKLLPVALVLSVLAFSVSLVRADEMNYDLNGDGRVDILDLKEVAKAFASVPGDPKWNPDADFNEDNKIDLKDYAIIASHFEQTKKLLVVPEYWMGPVLGLAGCFAAFGLFRAAKIRRP